LSPKENKLTAIILAGGQGTRLFPLTEMRCKPAVSFGGKYRLIDIPISNALNSGIPQIYIIAQFYASGLLQHINTTYHCDLLKNGGIEMLTPEEKPHGKIWFKGTADAVRQNLEHILKVPSDYFLILSGDQLYNMNFMPMLDFAIKNQADLVISALSVKQAEAKRMGLLQVDSSHQVLDFFEKPQDSETLNRFAYQTERYLGSMGIYIFKKQALISLLQQDGDDFGHHLIPAQLKLGNTYAYIYDGYWEDIGTIASFYEANLALMSQKQHLEICNEHLPIYFCPHQLPSPIIHNADIDSSIICQGTLIEKAAIIQRSILGIRTHIKKGTIIKDCVIHGNHQVYPPPIHFSIGENCQLEKAIIDEETIIGNHVKLTNEKRLQSFDGPGIYIRDGIIIVTTGTKVPDNYKL
jgi:glucose-1-phosphate adenylyltransferase